MYLFLKNLLFTLFVPGTVAVMGPLFLVQGEWAQNSYLFILGLLFLLIGLAIYIWCIWDFASVGHATPAPIDAPKQLIIQGLYQYVRNPMYVGVLSIILGWALLYAYLLLLLYGVTVAMCFQLLVVYYEEPTLEQLFGEEYVEYKADVNRWLPALFKASSDYIG